MADSLPKGWKSAKSTRRPDQTYYYHRFGEATWDRPSIPAPKASKRVRFKTALKPARCPPSPVGDCKRSAVQEYYGPQSSGTSTTFATVSRHNTDSYDYIYDSPSHSYPSYSGYSTSYSSRSYEISSPYQGQSTSRMGGLLAGIGAVIGTLSIVGIVIAMIVGTLWAIKIAVLETFEIVVQVPGHLASSLSALFHILLYPFGFVMPALEWCWELCLIPLAAIGQAVQLVTRLFLFLILSPLTLIKGGLNILSGEGIQYRMGGDNPMSSWLQAPSIPPYDAPILSNNSNTALVILSLTVFAVIAAVFFNKMDRQTAAIDALAETVSETGGLLADGLAQGVAVNVELTAAILHQLGSILNAVQELGPGNRGGAGRYGQARVGMPARALITADGEATTGRKIGMVASAVTIATGVAALGGSCNVM